MPRVIVKESTFVIFSVSNIVLANQLMFIQGVPQIRVRSFDFSEKRVIFVEEKTVIKTWKAKTVDVVGLLNLFPTAHYPPWCPPTFFIRTSRLRLTTI